LTPYYFQETAILGAIYSGLAIFALKNNLDMLACERSLIVIVVPQKIVQQIGKYRSGMPNVWAKFTLCVGRVTLYTQWRKTQCQWYLMRDVATHNSRKYLAGVNHVTCLLQPSSKVKVTGYVMYQHQKCYNSAVGGCINFKLGGNFHCGGKTYK